jgi:ABC-type glutathione transport system ATPase component
MTWVTEFCTRALLIEEGRVVMDGAPEEVVRTHREHSLARRAARRERIELMRRGEIAIEPGALPPPEGQTRKSKRR